MTAIGKRFENKHLVAYIVPTNDLAHQTDDTNLDELGTQTNYFSCDVELAQSPISTKALQLTELYEHLRVIELRSGPALMPLRIFRNLNWSAANLIMLFVGTAMFGMFFFLTIFVQTVWGYSALKTGIAYLPLVTAVMVMAGVSAVLVPRIGARPLLLAGSAAAGAGCSGCRGSTSTAPTPAGCSARCWSPRRPGHAVHAADPGRAVQGRDRDAGLASSLPNVGQQVGGSIGLAILGTVAWTVVANTARNSTLPRRPPPRRATRWPAPPRRSRRRSTTTLCRSASPRGFEVSAGIMLIALIITIAAVRVRRADLASTQAPQASPAVNDMSAEMPQAG